MVYNNHMEEKKIIDIIKKQFEGEYYTAKELMYSRKAGVYLSPFEYKEYLNYVDEVATNGDSVFRVLPLPSFNSKCLYFCYGKGLSSLLDSYINILKEYDLENADIKSSFINSRIYSEIEGTLNIENVPTTRKRLNELLLEDKPPVSKNDVIIKNMKSGIDFVNKLPEFNKDNLLKLYSILSNNCLEDEDKLKEGHYYRDDVVEISHYHGAPVDKIDECMDALFSYVKEVLNQKVLNYEYLLLPHICHFYLLYIHPYFDYNGRTARMVSYWVYLLSESFAFPPIISEAINQTKNKYYLAIELSRDAHNDLTYFLKYLLEMAIDYSICYQDLEYIIQKIKNKGFVLTDTDINYMKRILVTYNNKFTYQDFLKMANIDISKQGALKILNKFIEFDFLKEVPNSSKNKLFDVNKDMIIYPLRYFGYQNKK